jgi:hypothetical protein
MSGQLPATDALLPRKERPVKIMSDIGWAQLKASLAPPGTETSETSRVISTA